MKRRSVLAALWVGGGLLALLLVLRTFVADLYRVDSGSMEPTIHGGNSWDEWVLVRYEGPDDLERFDLAVAYSDVGELVVKRVVGLPGENVQVLGGDLFIDSARLGAADARPSLVPLFDSAHHSIESEFRFDESVWTETPEGWVHDSRGLPSSTESSAEPSAEPSSLYWLSSLDDGYLLPDFTRVSGSRAVSDGGVDLDVELLSLGGVLFVELREAGDAFRASLSLGEARSDSGRVPVLARLERLRIQPNLQDLFGASMLVEPELLAERSIELELDALHQLHFSNVDNTLYLSVAGELALSNTYSDNRPLEGVSVAPGKTIGAEVTVGGDRLHARIRALRIARDLHWVSKGDYGVERPVALGPGEYFLLGDNSAHSLDGRTWGATKRSDLLGRPLDVIWPRARARSLAGEHWRRVSR